MTQLPRVAIVIPVFNHARFLRPVVEEALRVHDHVLVVDDGSTDDVRAAVSGLSVPILRHSSNEGKGRAILDGRP